MAENLRSSPNTSGVSSMPSNAMEYALSGSQSGNLSNTGWFDKLGGGQANKQALNAQAERDLRYQEYMSNTAFQRQVEDMKKAGLNPAMLYSSGGGKGASSPSGSSAHSRSGGESVGLVPLLNTAIKMIGVVASKGMDNDNVPSSAVKVEKTGLTTSPKKKYDYGSDNPNLNSNW